MASIRGRITTTYAFAVAATMFAFTVAVWYERNKIAKEDLSDRAASVADLALRMTRQAGTENMPLILSGDSVLGRGFSPTPRFRALLDVLPEYVVIADSNRVVYSSFAVRRLTPSDSETFADGLFALSRNAPGRLVTMDSDQVVLVGRFEDPGALSRAVRVVAGVSTAPLVAANAQVAVLAFIVGPLILLVSVGVAWALAGRTLEPVERMVNDVEAITDGRFLHRRIPVEELGDEIGRLGEALNAMIARLEASFATLHRFTADASHELKTPLAVLRADIERAMSSPRLGTEQLVALEEALQEATRMAGLVESLLTLARADEGRFDLHREPVSLEPLVRDVAETALILGEEAGLTVSLERADPVAVLGDAVRLRQLFLNLVENAVKYTARGGSVSLSLEAKDGVAAFAVRDTGIGIAGADLPYIFDRFWRVDRARSRTDRAGAGLGLAICQWIAQAHGGSITVSSRMGRGSTFTVTLPAHVSPATPPEPNANPPLRKS